MIRVMCVVVLLAATVMSVVAQGIGDFDCTSDADGPYTPAGTLRIEAPNSFAFLDPATATPGPYYPMAMIDDEQVNFDGAFADQISPGGAMVEASWFEDESTFEAVILTKKGKLVLVSCPFIP